MSYVKHVDGVKDIKTMDTLWELHAKIEKIVENNVKKWDYEGDEVDKQGIVDAIMELIPTIPYELIEKINKQKQEQNGNIW